MSHTAILIFTARGPERIVREGGSQAWVLDPRRARKCEFAVLTQNRGFIERGDDWGNTTEPHGAGFMVGRILDVVRCQEPDAKGERWLVRFSEYARLDVPQMWPGYRNPIYYTSLEDLGVDFGSLQFEPMPDVEDGVEVEAQARQEVRPLTIAQAKEGLAASFGVSVDAIEITIRG